MNDKQNLRIILRKRRQSFENEHLFWPETGENLPRQFRRVIDCSAVVAGYARMGSEVDPTGLMALALHMGKTTALPWLADRGASLIFRQWAPGDQLEVAPFGFGQPRASAPECVPDVILTPLLGFDRALNRLGQGAGHYDRVFAAYPDAFRIGIAWSVQECASLRPDSWDIPLDAVLTEKEWIASPQSRIRPL